MQTRRMAFGHICGSASRICLTRLSVHNCLSLLSRPIILLAPFRSRMSSIPSTAARNSGKVTQVPRPSASVIVVNALNEILLVHRNPKASAFAGFHVFPGGNYDATQDESSFKMTAIRETFEESGLLLASSASPEPTSLSEEALNEARHAIHSQRTPFKAFLAEHQLKPDLSSLLPFTEWITPADAPRRFHARFYLAFLPSAASAGFKSGDKHDRIPTPDGGQEVIAARFVHPDDILAECKGRKISLMPPQFYLISTLAGVLHGRQNTAAQRAHAGALSRGMFGKMVINPKRIHDPETSNGLMVLALEGDETRNGPKGRLHRIHVNVGKAGVTADFALFRNFDILSEIEPEVFSQHSKL